MKIWISAGYGRGPILQTAMTIMIRGSTGYGRMLTKVAATNRSWNSRHIKSNAAKTSCHPTTVASHASTMSNVHTIKLNDGTVVPTLGFGTGTALFGKDATSAVRQAIEKAGYTHIDCAEAYGNEVSVGDAIIASDIPREQLFLTSKCNTKDPRRSLENSLAALETSYIDLYLIHSPIVTSNIAEAWKVMEELKAEGKVRSIGVSNFRVKDLETVLAVAKVVPSVNQIEVHPYVFASIQPVLELCRKHNITIESYGPLTPLIRHSGGPVDAPVKKIAARIAKGPEPVEVTEGQVLLKWAQQRTGGIIITTSSKLDRLLEQKASLDLPPLSNEELRSIEEEGSKKHYRHFMKHMDQV